MNSMTTTSFGATHFMLPLFLELFCLFCQAFSDHVPCDVKWFEVRGVIETQMSQSVYCNKIVPEFRFTAVSHGFWNARVFFRMINASLRLRSQSSLIGCLCDSQVCKQMYVVTWNYCELFLELYNQFSKPPIWTIFPSLKRRFQPAGVHWIRLATIRAAFESRPDQLGQNGAHIVW